MPSRSAPFERNFVLVDRVFILRSTNLELSGGALERLNEIESSCEFQRVF